MFIESAVTQKEITLFKLGEQKNVPRSNTWPVCVFMCGHERVIFPYFFGHHRPWRQLLAGRELGVDRALGE